MRILLYYPYEVCKDEQQNSWKEKYEGNNDDDENTRVTVKRLKNVIWTQLKVKVKREKKRFFFIINILTHIIVAISTFYLYFPSISLKTI